MPRFAILEHDYPVRHWDLLLEAGPACRTWRLSAPPRPGQLVLAEAIPDHRLMYLDYAGPVSGDRGTVQQWDAGHFTWITATAERITILLHGRHSHVRLTLRQASSGSQAEVQHW